MSLSGSIPSTWSQRNKTNPVCSQQQGSYEPEAQTATASDPSRIDCVRVGWMGAQDKCVQRTGQPKVSLRVSIVCLRQCL